MYDGETELLKQKFVHEKVLEVEFHDDGNVIQRSAWGYCHT